MFFVEEQNMGFKISILIKSTHLKVTTFVQHRLQQKHQIQT